MPTSELDALLAKAPPPIADLTRRARALILAVRPGAGERVWPGWKAVGFGEGTSMKDFACLLSPSARWVRMSFMRADLPDPEGLLEKSEPTGAGHHVRLGSVADLERPAIRALIEASFAATADASLRGAPKKPRERAAGAHVVSGSKTVNVPIGRLFEAWTDDALRARWLPEPFTVRKATANRSLRITWADGSSVEALFLDKGADKSAVQVDHSKLADAEVAAQARVLWKERLAALKTLLES